MQNIRPAGDQYTKQGYIAAKEGFWNAMSFTYRPATHAERIAYDDAIRDSKGAASSRVVCTAVAKHVKSWDEADAAGKLIAITADTINQLDNTFLVDRLYNIVRGWECSDPKPSSETDVMEAENLIQSLLENVPPGVIGQENDRKN